MNSGSASSSWVVKMFQVYCASSLSSGMSRKMASRIVPVAASVQPIHKPPARKANSTTNMVITTISMQSEPTTLASFGARAGTHVEVLQRQAGRRLQEAGNELQHQQTDAERHQSLRYPKRAVA